MSDDALFSLPEEPTTDAKPTTASPATSSKANPKTRARPAKPARPSQSALPTATSADLDQQWRMCEIQLANWGTFDNAIYTIPIARAGHLITGPSGSGKSSLLDAIATVLTPDKWLRFNLAAQGAGSRADQRTIMSYLRGAWTKQAAEDEDRIVSQYLRKRATWSGILLRYRTADPKTPAVTLVRLLFVRGTGTSMADVNDLCMIERGEVGLADLEQFARGGIESRKLKAAHPDAVVTTNGAHARFYARMRAHFDIANESALQLLHKTQSAKNLDSLDDLFRTYMLDRPRTFDMADTAVAQFGDLKDAHDHVVQARLQRDHLLQLRTAAQDYDAAQDTAASMTSLIDHLEPYGKRRLLTLARADFATAAQRAERLEIETARAAEGRRRALDRKETATQRVLQLGGAEVSQLTHRIDDARNRARATRDRRARWAERLRAADIGRVPESAEDYAELVAQIDRSVAEYQSKQGDEADREKSYAENERFAAARREVERINQEITAMQRSGTTLPHRYLEARRHLAAALNLPDRALPYAAELITVRSEFAGWTGAIERVLRPLALTVLVPSRHLPAVRRWIDTHSTGIRFRFEEVRGGSRPRPAASDKSLVHRVSTTPGEFGDWILATLSERFDFACVDGPDELDDFARAVTVNGQVKSSQTRYEKDDRFDLNRRSEWVLGDREAKHEALVAQVKDAMAEFDAAKAVVDATAQRAKQEASRIAELHALRSDTWEDLDAAGAQATIAALQETLEQLTRTDGDLKAAQKEAATADAAFESADSALAEVRLEFRNVVSERDELGAQIADLEGEVAAGRIADVPEDTWKKLDRRFGAVQRSITRKNLAELANRVQLQLHNERRSAEARSAHARDALIRLATGFNDTWPAAAAGASLTPSVDDRAGYLALLDQIIAHGLPEFEARFLELLRDRSRDLVGELRSEILDAPREIEDRILPINASLGQAKFDIERYLQLRVKVRRTQTVTEFLGTLKSVSEGNWSDDDPATAERRFEILEGLIRRFASSDHVDKSWTRQCLDTRLHVTFLAEEVDEHGRVQATYDSGAAMSGGQQQKLVVFCLAAALRFQLAPPEQPYARYGTIVLDEAFDKADTRYTRMALDVFVQFGFQLVLATPHKLLQTIEQYVGAATSVENPTRARSLIANVDWENR